MREAAAAPPINSALAAPGRRQYRGALMVGFVCALAFLLWASFVGVLSPFDAAEFDVGAAQEEVDLKGSLTASASDRGAGSPSLGGEPQVEGEEEEAAEGEPTASPPAAQMPPIKQENFWLGPRGIDWGGASMQPPVRVAFTILANGMAEVEALEELLPLIYTKHNVYVIHLDNKSSKDARARLQKLIVKVLNKTSPPANNVVSLEPAMSVAWGGMSMLMAALWALGRALKMSQSWDYLINLSAAHLPLLPPRELSLALRVPRLHNASFFVGERYKGPLSPRVPDRRATYHEDTGIYRAQAADFNVMRPLGQVSPDGSRAVRPLPTLFDVWKGEFWGCMHRSFAEYVDKAPDNMARVLLTYFGASRFPEEAFFQSLACVHDGPRLTTWNETMHFLTPFKGMHTIEMSPQAAWGALKSGKLFARRFDLSVEGRKARQIVTDFLGKTDEEVVKARLRRVVRRFRAARPLCGPNSKHGPGVTSGYFANVVEEQELSETEVVMESQEEDTGEAAASGGAVAVERVRRGGASAKGRLQAGAPRAPNPNVKFMQADRRAQIERVRGHE